MQLYAPDDGRGDAQNMLSHIRTSSDKLVKNSCILLVDLFELYDDTRTYEHQTTSYLVVAYIFVKTEVFRDVTLCH